MQEQPSQNLALEAKLLAHASSSIRKAAMEELIETINSSAEPKEIWAVVAELIKAIGTYSTYQSQPRKK